MTDTHTHLYMEDVYPDGGVKAVENALAAGVGRMVLPCVNPESLPMMRRLHERFPSETFLALGLHPTDVGDDFEEVLRRMEAMLPGDFVAIGEVGIDLYHDASRREQQKVAFRRQLEWAVSHDLPVIIHCREGLDDTLEVLSDFSGRLPRLIFHSFTGSPDDVRKIRSVCDPWFGINGVVTFKNAPALREALKEIGPERIVLETDAPWLSPVPVRGTLNESSRIPYIRDCVARELGLSPEETERITDESASFIFRF